MTKKLLAIFFLSACVLGAMDIQPAMNPVLFWEVAWLNGTKPDDTTVAHGDSIITSWIIPSGHFSEGTLFWHMKGSGGAIDSVQVWEQLAYVKWYNGLVDTNYQWPWSRLYTIKTDTISELFLQSVLPDGKIPAFASRYKFKVYDAAHNCVINAAGLYLAGSK